MSANWRLKILLCLTPDDFTCQWGTPWAGKGKLGRLQIKSNSEILVFAEKEKPLRVENQQSQPIFYGIEHNWKIK